MVSLIRIHTVRGVPIYVHWSVFALCFFFLGTGLKHILVAAAGMAAYLAVLVIHELGHHFVAVRRRYSVDRIEIYPLHGICKFEEPEYPLDAAAIAWGGVVAQFLVAAPLVLFVFTFGYTGFGPADVTLAILGFLSPAIALLNLLPIAPLDGKLAWSYFPLRLAVQWPKPKPQQKTALQALEDAVRKAKR